MVKQEKYKTLKEYITNFKHKIFLKYHYRLLKKYFETYQLSIKLILTTLDVLIDVLLLHID